MKGEYNNIKIAGIASAVPKMTIDNMDYIRLYDGRKIRKQIKMTGIERTHVCVGLQKESDLCREAAKKLMEHLGWDPKEISVLLFCTQSADYHLPSTAIDLTTQLGISKDCMAYDINLGCSAFDLGIQSAAGLLQSQPEHSKALVLVGDVAYYPSGITKRADIMANTMMFGAGGGVAAIEKEEGNSFVFANYCDGEGYDAILRYPLTATMMNGNKVFDYSINDVSNNIKKFLADNDLSFNDIDGFFFHQAQKLIVDCIANTCELPTEKVYTSYTEYGNTSGASVPITMCHNKDKCGSGDALSVLSCGFGVGLSMGVSYYNIDKKNILPILETDEAFVDHMKRGGFLYTRHVLIINPASEMMQCVTRQMDMSTCKIDMIGDKASTDKLHSQMIFKDGTEYESFDDLISCSKAQYNSVIYDLDDTKVDAIKKQLNSINDNGLFKENSSCVIIANKKKNSREDLLKIVDDISECIDDGIRVLLVMCDPDTMDFYPNVCGDISWCKKRIYEDDTDAMVRALYMVGPIVLFLFADGAVVKKEIVDISEVANIFD